MGKFMELFVQREETCEPTSPPASYDAEWEMETTSAGIELSVNAADETEILHDAYAGGNFPDNDDGIFKVGAMIATLPAEMTTAKKQSTINGMLPVVGLDAQLLYDDGQSRYQCVQNAIEKWEQNKAQIMTEAEKDIEELKQMIETAQQKIADAIDRTEFAKKVLTHEGEKLEELVRFVGGLITEEVN